MTEAKHTPGPWEIIETHSRLETTVCGPVKTTFLRTRNVSPVDRDHNCGTCPDCEEAWANARLIVAAPELFQALGQMLSAFDGAIGGLDVDGVTFEHRADAVAAAYRARLRAVGGMP